MNISTNDNDQNMDLDDIEITSISVGYTRKINHKLYGAAEFETSDHPITLFANIRDGQNILTVYDMLSQACQELVNQSVENEITSFAGGLTPDKFYNYIRDFVANRPIDGEVYQQCNPRQKAILQAIKRGKQMHKRDDQKQEGAKV